jgi:hypothetical protein
MLQIAAAWLGLLIVLFAVGGIVMRCFLKTTGGDFGEIDLFKILWLGYAALIAFLQIISLISPINAFLAAGIDLVAVESFWVLRHQWRSSLRLTYAMPSSLRKVVVLAAGCMIVLVLYYAASPLKNVDTEGYHIGMVKWSTLFPAVPGLANLHGRFGFNSSFLVFGAFVNNGPFRDKVIYIANSLLVLMLSMEWMVAVVRTLAGKVQFSTGHFYKSF